MPELVSTRGICWFAGYTGLNDYARGGSAISSEARAAQKAATAVVESAERSQVLFGEKAAAISQLRALANECADEGWDGAGANAISSLAVSLAEDFVRALPGPIPLPEFAPEPDGSISLDWIQSRNRLFTLSVGNNNRLAYAWIDGSDKGHGVARFDGWKVPSRVTEGIQSIVNHGNAPFRAV